MKAVAGPRPGGRLASAYPLYLLSKDLHHDLLGPGPIILRQLLPSPSSDRLRPLVGFAHEHDTLVCRTWIITLGRLRNRPRRAGQPRHIDRKLLRRIAFLILTASGAIVFVVEVFLYRSNMIIASVRINLVAIL